jgi:hypothetical protein
MRECIIGAATVVVREDNGVLKWINGNLIFWEFEKYWLALKINYGFLMFLSLLFFLICKLLFKRRRAQ